MNNCVLTYSWIKNYLIKPKSPNILKNLKIKQTIAHNKKIFNKISNTKLKENYFLDLFYVY